MHVRVEKAAAWSGLAMTVVFMVALGLIAGVIPPFDPAESAAETAHRFSDNQVRMQIGLALMILFAYFYAPFFALLARQVRRIEGYWGVMSVTQILVGVVVPFGFALCAIFAAAAAFRVDRSPEVTQGLSDIFWFIFVGLVGPFLTQTLVLAFAIFMDGRTVPSFPRWFGYFNIWCALLAAPGCAIYVFKTGPLAWNGMFAFWIPLTVFLIWLIVTTMMLLKAVDVEAGEREKAAAAQEWEPAA